MIRRLVGAGLGYGHVMLGVALACGPVFGCGSPGSDAADGGGKAGSGSTITIPLPPPVEQRLTSLVEQLAQIVCERSRNCCPGYGLRSIGDCTDIAGAPFVQRASQVLFGGGPDGTDYSIDEGLAAACLQSARSVANDCGFATEKLLYTWTLPCMHALRIVPKGEPPTECDDDHDCESTRGAGHRCFEHRCLAVSVMPTGSSCAVPSGPTSIPGCGPAGYCNSKQVCAPIGGPGEACDGSANCCTAGSYCQPGNPPVCAAQVGAGEPCDSSPECLEGTCACPAEGCSGQSTCLRASAIGDACTTDNGCGALLRCLAGRCVPRKIGICQ